MNFRDNQDQTDQGEGAILWKLGTKQGLSGQKETKEAFLFYFFFHTHAWLSRVGSQATALNIGIITFQ